MDSFAAFNLFRSLKLHFTNEKYDFVKFNGKVSGTSVLTKQKFESNKTKVFYEALAKHKDPTTLLVSNFIVNPKLFITDIVNNGQKNYEKYLERRIRLYYNLTNDLRQFESIADLKQDYPHIIEKYISGDITAESVVLIDRCIDKLHIWKTDDNPVIAEKAFILYKYKSLVPIDNKKLKSSFEKVF